MAVVSGNTVKHFKITVALSSVAQNATVDIMNVEDGYRILDGIVEYDALGSSTSLELGDSTDPNRFLEANVSTSAGRAAFDGVGRGGLDEYTAASTITLKQVGSGSATGNVTVSLWYSQNFD